MIILQANEKVSKGSYDRFEFQIEWCIEKLLGKNAFSIARTYCLGSYHPRRKKQQIELNKYKLTGVITDQDVVELQTFFNFPQNITGDQVAERLNKANKFVIENYRELFRCANKSKQVYETLKFETFEDVANSDALKDFFTTYHIDSLEDRVSILRKYFSKVN